MHIITITRPVRLGATAAALAVLLAACSSNSGSPPVAAAGNGPTASSSAAPRDPAHAWATWAACMRQHGVAMSDPVLDAQNQPQIDFSHAKGVPESVKRAARQACQSIVANLPGPNTSGGPQNIPKELAFARCMRTHGMPNFPDPDPATGQFNLAGAGIDPQSPTAQQAAKTCQSQVGGGAG